MKFDIGQRVLTSEGEAIVTARCRTPGGVTTDIGMFPEELVAPWVDVTALRSDPTLMNAWLDGEVDPEVGHGDPWKNVVAVDEHCLCDCGQAGRCHHILHMDGDQVIFRSTHMTISTDCRCDFEGCACLT